jgi:hypothetical protein
MAHESNAPTAATVTEGVPSVVMSSPIHDAGIFN